jgi:eukaryotic-like serine/threonine-protein kinase
MTSDPRPPDGLIAGKYRLTRLLGQGGMGTVWEGVHESLGTRVAVKFIDTEYAASDDVRARFVNEAKAAARLRSKHVVQVYDQGVGDDGRPYIVMEFLSGEPLDRRLDRLGRLSPEETARVVLHVCRALARAHESGIVHRDLKPENVFLVHDEEDDTDIAKVVDFGIAKITDTSPGGSSSTRTGAVLGTPQFMSPEQARGLRSVDRRTDLWSLGVIAYRCLVGSLPFKGEAVGDLLVNICTSDALVPSAIEPSVPSGFDAWVRRALAREPADRFQSPADLADTLAVVCGVEGKLGGISSGRRELPSTDGPIVPGAVTAAPLATTPAPFSRSRRPPWAVLAVLFVALTAAVVVGARAVMHAEPEPPTTAAGAVPAQPGLPTAAPPAPTPEVTPVTSAVAPPAPTQASEPVVHPPGGTPARRGRAGKAVAAPAETNKGSTAPTPTPARPRSPDVLGY